jgi:membrane-bound lytic murein transglycosylase B
MPDLRVPLEFLVRMHTGLKLGAPNPWWAVLGVIICQLATACLPRPVASLEASAKVPAIAHVVTTLPKAGSEAPMGGQELPGFASISGGRRPRPKMKLQEPQQIQVPQEKSRMPGPAAMFAAWVDSVQTDALDYCPDEQKQVLMDVLSELVHDVEELDEDSMDGRRLSEGERQVDLDRSSAKSVPREAMHEHVGRLACAERVRVGQKKLQQNRATIERIAAIYGVPAELLVAMWGIESSYGSYMGEHDVVHVLAKDAYRLRGTPTGDYLRDELLAALKLLSEGNVKPGFRGSEAGAIGQCQFMPSNFFQFAVDGDEDGFADIWTSMEDTLSSIGNFLKSKGYARGTDYGTVAIFDGELVSYLLAASESGRHAAQYPRIAVSAVRHRLVRVRLHIDGTSCDRRLEDAAGRRAQWLGAQGGFVPCKQTQGPSRVGRSGWQGRAPAQSAVRSGRHKE